MTSCTIVISHFHSLPFLRQCIRQIRKHSNKNIRQHIIICDQSDVETFNKIIDEFNQPDITLVNTKPLYSGYGIDYIMRYYPIKTEYIAQYHCDALPISDNHLYLPIKLIEENNFSFVGQLQFINAKEKLSFIYPPNPFFAMAQCFNVARKETYEEMSWEAGFTRFHNRPKSGLTYKMDDWLLWASKDYPNRGSDDDVVAFHWEDTHREHNKLGLAISGFISPSYGRIIDDLVFHFGSANEARGVMSQMPPLYQLLTEEINENYSDKLINYMVELAKKNKPNGTEILSRNLWDGKLKECIPIPDELNKRIEELKL